MKPLFGCLHPPHVLRAADKEQPREDLLDERPDLGKCERWSLARPTAFGLKKREGHRADDHVMLPAGVRASFEMIEPEFGLEVLIVLFDRPAVMGQPHELWQRGRRRQRDDVVPATAGRTEPALAEQPDVGGQPPTPPVGGRGHAKGREIGGPRRLGAVAPLDPVPRPRSQRVADRPDADGVLGGPPPAARRTRSLIHDSGR